MPPRWSPPVTCLEVEVTYDILTPDRVQGQLTVFQDKISFLLRADQFRHEAFDLFDFTVQTLPNLDTLLVIGSRATDVHNIYAFLPSVRARDNCLSTMRLLGFCLLDAYGNRLGVQKITESNSMPAMSTIWEDWRDD